MLDVFFWKRMDGNFKRSSVRESRVKCSERSGSPKKKRKKKYVAIIASAWRFVALLCWAFGLKLKRNGKWDRCFGTSN